MNVEQRREQHEQLTGQKLYFMVPLSPKEIALGAFSMVLLGFLGGYVLAIHLFEHYLRCR